MDPKQLALAHFEKAVLGAFGAWLLLSLVGIVKPPAELQANDQLKKKLDDIKTYMETEQPKVEPVPSWSGDLQRGLDPKGVRTVEPNQYPSWLAWRRPNLAFTVKQGPTRPQPVHAEPHDFKGLVARGKVDLTWQAAGSDENAYIIIEEYELQRRDLPSGQFAPLTKLRRDPKENAPPMSFTDSGVPARSKFEYKLIETAKIDEGNPEVIKWKMTLPDLPKAPVTRELVWGMDVETPRDIYIVPAPESVMIPAPAAQAGGAKPKVHLKVFKFDPVSNSFKEHTYFSVEEGPIPGKIESIGGGAKLDFTSKAELVEIRVERRKVKLAGTEVEKDVGIIKLKWPGIEAIEEQDEVSLPADVVKKPTAPLPPGPRPTTPPKPGPSAPKPPAGPAPGPGGK